jgi:outer membrane protein OmpA-like peptidoglycan-associated protein
MEAAMARISRFQAEVEADESDASVLLSIGDLMSGLLMFFALLFVTAMVQLKEVEKQQRIFVGTLVGQLKGNSIDVTVDPEKGDVSIREAILFDEGSSALKPEGKAFLQQFIPVYSQVIFSQPVFDQQVARVVIEGHTSSKGSPAANLELSLARSLAVSKYIFSNQLEFPSKPQLVHKIMAAGRGEVEADQTQDIAGDRKVLFRFQFKGKELSE